MKNKNVDYKANFEKVVAMIMEEKGCSRSEIERVIEETNDLTRVSFVKIKGYNSDVSNNTEIAEQLINIGTSYDNALMNDMMLLANCDVNTLDVNKHNYDNIDLNGLTLGEFKFLVGAELHNAKEEMSIPPTEKDDYVEKENNDVWLNKVLVFNTKTKQLSIQGVQINKTVTEKGVFKKVKSAPLTIAKVIIRKQLGFKTDKIRRFKLSNLNGLTLKGDTFEIGGGKEYTEANTSVRYEPANTPQRAN